MAIRTQAELGEHLELAMRVEMARIPPSTMSLGDGTVASPQLRVVELGAHPVAGLVSLASSAVRADPSVAGIVAALLHGEALAPLRPSRRPRW